MKEIIFCFNKQEKLLWITSIAVLLVVNIINGNIHYLSLVTTLIGLTGLIYLAKGNIIGQLTTIIFSILYGYISYEFGYYGEMITYVGMTGPMALLAAIQWLKNPYEGAKHEVEVATINKKTFMKILLSACVVTGIFYFILKYFNTQNLLFSSISITTSFTAVALTYYRSQLYALAYVCNDLILIVLWTYATIQNTSYITMVVCFIVFLVNDLYAYYNWNKIKQRQAKTGL